MTFLQELKRLFRLTSTPTDGDEAKPASHSKLIDLPDGTALLLDSDGRLVYLKHSGGTEWHFHSDGLLRIKHPANTTIDLNLSTGTLVSYEYPGGIRAGFKTDGTLDHYTWRANTITYYRSDGTEEGTVRGPGAPQP